jgi:hypothetical protein
MTFLPQRKVSQMEDGFIWGYSIIPVFNNQFLPVFWAIAVSPNIFVEEMGIGNDPCIWCNFE